MTEIPPSSLHGALNKGVIIFVGMLIDDGGTREKRNMMPIIAECILFVYQLKRSQIIKLSGPLQTFILYVFIM